MPKMWVQSLGQEDPREKEIATHSSIAWEIPWIDEPGGILHGVTKSWTRLSTWHMFDLIGRGKISWVHSFAHIAPLGGHEQRTDLQGTYTGCVLYTDKRDCLHSNAHACTKKTVEGCLVRKYSVSSFFLWGAPRQGKTFHYCSFYILNSLFKKVGIYITLWSELFKSWNLPVPRKWWSCHIL